MRARAFKFEVMDGHYILEDVDQPSNNLPLGDHYYTLQFDGEGYTLTEAPNTPGYVSNAGHNFWHVAAFRLEDHTTSQESYGQSGRYHGRIGAVNIPIAGGPSQVVRNGLSFIGTTEIEDIGDEASNTERILVQKADFQYWDLSGGTQIFLGMSALLPGVVLVFSSAHDRDTSHRRALVNPSDAPIQDQP